MPWVSSLKHRFCKPGKHIRNAHRHPPAAGGPVSGSRLQDTPPLALLPCTAPWPEPDPVSAFLEPGCEIGLSFVVSTSGRAGLVSADYSRALGQPGSEEEAQLQKKTQSRGTEKIIGTKAQSSRWVEPLAPVNASPHTSACPPPHPL